MKPLEGAGIWSSQLRYGEAGAIGEAAAELEALGFRALWIPDTGGEVFDAVERLLSSTTTITVATGILNLWMHSPEETAAARDRLTRDHGDRFLVGIRRSLRAAPGARHPAGARYPVLPTYPPGNLLLRWHPDAAVEADHLTV